ncbi:hypothetical protein D3C75_403910 [compost metagenome]
MAQRNPVDHNLNDMGLALIRLQLIPQRYRLPVNQQMLEAFFPQLLEGIAVILTVYFVDRSPQLNYRPLRQTCNMLGNLGS